MTAGLPRIGLAWVLLLFSSAVPAGAQQQRQIEVFSTAIRDFPMEGSDPRLRFIGGLEIASPDSDFGGFSGLRSADGMQFLAISDAGAWLSFALERGADGAPSAIANARMAPIRDGSGAALFAKEEGDAEGLEVSGAEAIVSFERQHRILRYNLPAEGLPGAARSPAIALHRHGLKYNRGLESVTLLPDGRILAVSEASLNAEGDIRAFRIGTERLREFSLRRRDGFSVTDAVLLADGRVLLLERDFSYISGSSMRLRLIDLPGEVEDRPADGEILLTAASDAPIDNMEGMAVWPAGDGQVRLLLVSDDNFSFLQQTVLLEFELDLSR